MKEIYIVSACRTAIGSFMGSLANCSPLDLGKVCATEALNRAGITDGKLDEVITGNVLAAGHGMNISRQVALAAGIHQSTPAYTINKVCGSGMKAITLAASEIASGRADCILAGGVESMSQAGFVSLSQRQGNKMGHAELFDLMVKDGLTDAMHNYHMGVTAENLAKEYSIGREQQDTFAFNSQQKAAHALKENWFEQETVSVPLYKRGKQIGEFVRDEYPRETSIEKLAGLRPAFDKEGSVTAGNASGINDGAAYLVLASKSWVESNDCKPLARLVEWSSGGVAPELMGVGPVAAVRNLQERAEFNLDELDVIESNEAFAVQALAVDQQLAWDTEKVNLGGGAIALGHPIGASGARIVVSLLHHMQRLDKLKGLATLCVGGGQGVATLFERV